MKNKNLFALLFIAAFLVAMTCCKEGHADTKNENNHEDSLKFASLPAIVKYKKRDLTLKDEKSLNFDVPDFGTAKIPEKTGEDMIELTRYAFLISEKPMEMLAAKIDTPAINKLKAVAESLTCTATCSNSIPGIRILYGVTSASVLILYYQPLVFCKILPGMLGHSTIGTYTICNEGGYYTYTANQATFTPVADVTVKDDDLARYKKPKEGIGILRDPASKPDNFITDPEILGDTKSIIFPFSEIVTLYNCKDSDKICIWNAVAKIDNDPGAYMVKHILLLSPRSVTNTVKNVTVPPVGSGFANLGHICPPSCNNAYPYTFVLGK